MIEFVEGPGAAKSLLTAIPVRSERVGLVMSVEEVTAIDIWRDRQPDWPSRSEAIRRLIEKGLAADVLGIGENRP